MKKHFLLASLLFIGSLSFSQRNDLPKGLTTEEQLLIQNGTYSFTSHEKGTTTPPTGSLRTMAQWEEVQTLVLSWTSGNNSILGQIVRHAQEECEVLIACSDSMPIRSYLTSQSIPLTNVRFMHEPTNSIWIRDYAGHTVYKNDVEDVSLVEWIYNRPRPADDVIADAHGAKKGIPVYSTTQAPNDFVNCGGNWMVDGAGTAFGSKLMLQENQAGNAYGVSAKTEAQVDSVVNRFMGIERYIKMETLPYDGIHHIDMHMKLLDEETLLVGEFPEGISDGPQMEANLQYVLSNFNSIYGTPYNVIRIPMPSGSGNTYAGGPYGNAYYRTYANFVFVNKTVIIPSYREEFDTIADNILKQALPGYKLRYIDVDNSGANLISGGGAIHCITNTIGVNDPLLIRHQNHPDTNSTVFPYKIDAFIKHASGIQEAKLYYSINDTLNYIPVNMVAIGGNMFRGEIPAQPEGTEIYYYIFGEATNGKQQVRPIVAPSGYFKFKILGGGDLSIKNLSDDIQFTVFPNPASAITCVDLSGIFAENTQIEMTSILGQQVITLHKGKLDGTKKLFFNATNYSSGTYLITVKTDTGSSVKRVVIH